MFSVIPRSNSSIPVEDEKTFTSKAGFYNPPTGKRVIKKGAARGAECSSYSALESPLLFSNSKGSTRRTFFYADAHLPPFSSPSPAYVIHWREKQLLRNNTVGITFAGELLPPCGEGPVTVEVREWESTDKDTSRRSSDTLKLFAAISNPFLIQCFGYQLTMMASDSETSLLLGNSSMNGGSFGIHLGGAEDGGTAHGLHATTPSTGLKNSTTPDFDKTLGPSSASSVHFPTTASGPSMPFFRYRLELFFEMCGITLDQWLKSNPKGLSIYVVRDLARQLLQGLSHLHLKGILHGDVNPKNIVFSSTSAAPSSYEGACVVKLADFSSFANLVEGGWCRDFKGTFPYMAPEIFHGSKKYGSRVDIWALGCTVLSMLGRHPWGNDTSDAPSLCVEVLRHPGCMPYGMPERSECPFMLFDFLQCCFQWDPDARPSADTLLVHPWITAEKQSLIEISREERHKHSL